MVDQFQSKRYDVNLIYTGSYDSVSSFELKRDPVKKPVFELAKHISQCLSNDLGTDRVYYPERDMLGGVNFFDEFDRVIDNSFVTLLLMSKDIANNRWFKWLNHSAVKREKDNIGLNTLFLAAPGMTREDIVECRCEFVLVDNVIYVEKEPTSIDEIPRTRWYQKIKASILSFSGRTTTNRQMSEQAQNPGTMASGPSRVIQSEEEAAAVNSVDHESPGPEQESRNFHGPRDTSAGARAERHTDEPDYRSPQEATDPPAAGIDAVLPAVKDGKQGRTEPGRTPPRPAQPAAEDTSRQATAGDTPCQPAAGDTLRHPAGGDTTHQSVARDTPRPIQPSSGNTPRQPSARDTPRQPSAGDTPRQPSAGDIPRQPSAGDTPRQPSAGDIPHQSVAGDTPRPIQPSAGNTPRQSSAGDTPNQSKGGASNGQASASKWRLTWAHFAIIAAVAVIVVWRRSR